MKTRTLLALALALTMLIALFAGCQTSVTDATDSQTPETESTDPNETSNEPTEALGETIKIGHICDLTGNEAKTGQDAQAALEFAVKALGGVFANHPIEIISGDAKGTTDGAVDLARKLVEKDGVVAIFGPTQAGQKTAVAEYMKSVELPLIFYNGSPDFLLAGNDWLVGVGGANAQLPSVLADYAYNNLDYQTVNVLTIDNIGFRGFSDVFESVFESHGGSVVNSAYAPFGSDWATYLAGLKDADAIVAWCTGGDSINLWKDWYTMGKTMPVTAIIESAFIDSNILDAVNDVDPKIAEAMLGTISPTMYAYNIDTPENNAFVEAWVDEFGKVPSTNIAGQVYQTVLLLKTALEDTNGDASPEVLIKALFEADVTGPAGRLFFDNSNAATKNIYICEAVKMPDGSFNSSILATYENVPPEGLK